jgi:predicted enzyme related to lactoylglutathione lyase
MGKRTEHAPGTFSWVDLGTTDADGAKAFYGELFGWEADDMPTGDDGPGVYSMLKIGDDYVAALYELGAEMRERGVPPNWLSYVTVADVEATAAKARELGGKVHAEPFDVLSAGRMTLIQDPGGAMLAAWQPKESIGAARVNDPGCLTWNELSTPDPDGAAAFYGGLFGWEVEAIDTGGGPQYSIIRNGGRSNGGMMGMQDEQAEIPPYWLPYFTVESTDDAVARAGGLGASTLAGPLDVPTGRIAALRDPQGAAFAVFQGEVDD